MAFEPKYLQQYTDLIEQRMGLSPETQTRIGIEHLVQGLVDDGYTEPIRELHDQTELDPVWQRLIGNLTIGETYFLRDKRHFRILRESILPEIIQLKRQSGDLQLRIWCAGCATGEEAYSVAITLYEFLPDITDWDIHIIGTDINRKAIEKARIGIYDDWSFRRVPDGFLSRYFDAIPNGYKLVPEIRSLVRFQADNLLTGVPIAQNDLVFARNILIYFSEEQSIKAEDMFFRSLAPGGWFFMGQAEALRSERHQWIKHVFPGNPIYQKPSPRHPISDGSVRYGSVSPTEGWTPAPTADSEEYRAAVKAVQADRHQQAEYHLSQLLSEQPRNAKAHTLLAFLFANRKAYPEAQAHIEEALRKDPLLADAHYIRAIIQMEQGQREQAIKSLTSALFCGRDHALAAFTLGNIYVQLGERDEARRVWESGLRALREGEADRFVSDLSDMTAQTLITLLEANLAGITQR